MFPIYLHFQEKKRCFRVGEWQFLLPLPIMKNFIIRLAGLVLLSYFQAQTAFGQPEWKFVTERDGIRISSRGVADSKVKALRVDCTLNAGAAAIVALLLDIDASVQWVSHTKTCTLVKQISLSELYYYSEVSLPWPLNNRDFVAHIKVTQDPLTKVVTVDAPAVKGFVKNRDNLVRITHSTGLWRLTPLGSKTTKVEYTLQVDPGGVIPAWLVNSLSAQGPMESFKGMKTQLLKPKYLSTKLPYIAD